MKVLVTGGAGYIGCVAVERLLEEGHHVTVFDSFQYRDNTLAHLCHNERLKIVKGDVRDKSKVEPLYAAHDCVVPLAAIVGAPACNALPVLATEVNKDSIFHMLDCLSQDQIIIMPTTNSAYGVGGDNNFCTEESQLNPISLYARDKVEVERRILEFKQVVSFRLATVFGMSPRMRLDLLVNDFVYRAKTDGVLVLFESHFKRNYVHVRDVASAFCFAIDNLEVMKGEIFNLGYSAANLTKLELALAIKEHLPNLHIIEHETATDPDQRNYIVSNEKLALAGFAAKISVDEGVGELLRGYEGLKNSNYDNLV